MIRLFQHKEKKENLMSQALSSLGEMLVYLDQAKVSLEPWLNDYTDSSNDTKLGEMIAELGSSIECVRNRSLNLSLEAWKVFFQERYRKMGMQATYNEFGDRFEIPLTLQYELTNILQEVCGNAVKHGQADMIQILTVYKDSGFKITIADNGVGIDLKKIESNQCPGKGLRGIKSRLEKLGGSIDFFNKDDGKGTVLVINIPECKADCSNDKEDKVASQLGHDLHDVLCPSVIAYVMMLEMKRTELTKNDAKKWYELMEFQEKLSSYSKSLRNFSHLLMTE